ncbi:hypothetical protein Taro_001754 [Colocasia esculenta]|uniref:NAC domain-containing protein n=1 Tax=Colocasia esculenta TaxID=4460 RepID=A0A843TJ05_COLES|nr:hypothetical protein [Colocasia esculenta]
MLGELRVRLSVYSFLPAPTQLPRGSPTTGPLPGWNSPEYQMDLYVHQFETCDGQLPPGFRFHPTDEELITYYLLKKVFDGSFTSRAIAEIDLNKCEPWELPAKAKMGEKEWYFFSLRDRKYPTGLRTNRATDAGYWKATGKDREIYSSRSCTLVGMKKTLVFYRGRAPKGEKSNWVMHEYRLEGKFNYHFLSRSSKDEWVVSRVFQKVGPGSKKVRVGVAGRAAASSGYSDAGSPSSSSVPLLPDASPFSAAATAGDHESCSYGSNAERDHVPCFSTAPLPVPGFAQLLPLASPPPPALRPGAVPSALPIRMLHENLELPSFFPGLSTAPSVAISSVSHMKRDDAVGENWPFDVDRKVDVSRMQLPVGAMVLDCLQSLLPSEQY